MEGSLRIDFSDRVDFNRPDVVQAGSAFMPANLLPVFDIRPSASDFASDVLKGLHRPQKSVPHKYLYDPLGSDLFEKLLSAPEYYVPGCEREIMDKELSTIAARAAAIASSLSSGAARPPRRRIF